MSEKIEKSEQKEYITDWELMCLFIYRLWLDIKSFEVWRFIFVYFVSNALFGGIIIYCNLNYIISLMLGSFCSGLLLGFIFKKNKRFYLESFFFAIFNVFIGNELKQILILNNLLLIIQIIFSYLVIYIGINVGNYFKDSNGYCNELFKKNKSSNISRKRVNIEGFFKQSILKSLIQIEFISTIIIIFYIIVLVYCCNHILLLPNSSVLIVLITAGVLIGIFFRKNNNFIIEIIIIIFSFSLNTLFDKFAANPSIAIIAMLIMFVAIYLGLFVGLFFRRKFN